LKIYGLVIAVVTGFSYFLAAAARKRTAEDLSVLTIPTQEATARTVGLYA